jgi:hypothetical protein
VSAAITQLFGSYGQEFQALNAQAALFHDQFVQLLSSGGIAYAAAEAANVSPLQALGQQAQALAAFSPLKDLTGRPLFGDGANGAPGTGQAGGNGGWLFGNGGNGGSGAPGQAGGAAVRRSSGAMAVTAGPAATAAPAPAAAPASVGVAGGQADAGTGSATTVDGTASRPRRRWRMRRRCC